ncbi:MAG TPA: septal ring lytic transglycosylase RlpA family protein [Actinomycetota bacterium]|nr:septal ring lytic transglycosylase RlpA family protein [Actinomycetota bacterium]
MRTKSALVLALALTATPVFPARATSPFSSDPRLFQTTGTGGQAGTSIQDVLSRLREMTDEYRRIQEGLDQAATDLKLTAQRRDDLSGQLVQAQDDLDGEAVRVYQGGAGAMLELILGAQTTRDLAEIGQITNRTLEVRNQTIERVTYLRSAANQTQSLLRARQTELQASARRLRTLASRIFDGLDRAQAIAVQSGLAQSGLLEQQQAFEELTADAANSLAALVAVASGANQSGLMSLLGATGGRTCAIPSGLRSTGQTLAGQASYYGWELAGNHTASGAVFDPRLFTAAHKTLPLGTFLRVQHAGRCAVVLVNDRGPYVGPRIIDLSQGVAEYLGMLSSGVGYVTAEILVPA